METLLYWFAIGGVKSLQFLPLRWVARLGRWVGGFAYYLDSPHRKVAHSNLTMVFKKERSAREIKALTKEHFRRLGENYASAIKTASMSQHRLARHLTVVGVEKIGQSLGSSRGRVVAIGHFGNFELYARAASGLDGYQFATTFRALNQPRLNQLLHQLRSKSGCLFFERRTDSGALREAMTHKAIILGLLSDQHAGQGGAWLPFFGRTCSTNTSAAIFAQRYKLPLFTAICYRTALAQWCIEVGNEIPTVDAGSIRRTAADIMNDVNHAFEAAIRRDPANWFWVHNRWRSQKRKQPRIGRRLRHDGSKPTN